MTTDDADTILALLLAEDILVAVRSADTLPAPSAEEPSS